MIETSEHFMLPLLPKPMLDQLSRLPQDKTAWPTEFRREYDRVHADFSQAKREFKMWIRKDRDSRMNKTAKAILELIIDCLNCDTGRCDPSHQFMADELGVSVRTIERTIPRVVQSRWLQVTRRGRTTSNFYRVMVLKSKVNDILDYSVTLRERRAEERALRKSHRGGESDPTKMADHLDGDPTKMADHDPTELAGHDPTKMAGKQLKRTVEDEHVNKGSCSDGREGTYPHAHVHEGSIPSAEVHFGPWVKAHIPNPFRHREALQLLREGRMTSEALERLSA